MKGRIGNPRWIGNLLAAWIGNRVGTDRKPVRLGSETRARIRNPLVLGSETREGRIGKPAVDRKPAGSLDRKPRLGPIRKPAGSRANQFNCSHVVQR